MFGKETEQGKADKESIIFFPQKQNEESGIVNKGKKWKGGGKLWRERWWKTGKEAKRGTEQNRKERRVEENLEIVNKSEEIKTKKNKKERKKEREEAVGTLRRERERKTGKEGKRGAGQG